MYTQMSMHHHVMHSFPWWFANSTHLWAMAIVVPPIYTSTRLAQRDCVFWGGNTLWPKNI